MFVFTMHKRGLKKAAVVVGCAALLALSAAAVGRFAFGEAAPTGLFGGSDAIELDSTSDMAEYLGGLGVEVDLSSAKVDKVKIPKSWDASFEAFNEVVRQGGLDLAKYKNKTVEKWDFVSPNKSTADQTVSAILLVYKEKLIGAYLIARPSGDVQPLLGQQPEGSSSAAQTAAEAGGETGQAVSLTPEQLAQVSAAGEAAGLTEEQIAAAAAAIESAAAQPGALPSE